MASKGETIRDYWKAITDNTIKGAIHTDGTFMSKILENKGSKIGKDGKPILNYWYYVVRLYQNNVPCPITEELIKSSDLDGSYRADLYTVSWQGETGAKKKSNPTDILTPKGTGKARTTVLTQAIRDAHSKFKKMDKSGSDRIACMLLKSSGDTKASIFTDVDYQNGIFVQKKYNGINCISYLDKQTNSIVSYSRDKKDVLMHKGITDDLMALLSKAAYDVRKESQLYICGELYKHGKSLQEISGEARRVKSDKSDTLEYHVYDLFIKTDDNVESIPAIARQELLSKIFDGLKLKFVFKADYYVVNNRTEIDQYTKQFLDEKYEGAVGRRFIGVYKPGIRSDDVVKFKPIYDSEFEVIGFTCGEKGDNAGALIWICRTENDKEFNVVPKDVTKDTMKRWYKILNAGYVYIKDPSFIKNSDEVDTAATSSDCISVVDENFILNVDPLEPGPNCIKVPNIIFSNYIQGHMLKVEYRDMSELGVPQQAKAVIFRELEDCSASSVMSQVFL